MDRSTEVAWNFSPPGHFYSPHPDLDEVESNAARLFPLQVPATLPGIELNAAGQLALLDRFQPFYGELPWSEQAQPAERYFLDCGYFCHGDGVALYSMLRLFRPRRIIEIGSGFSSAAMLDVIERFLGGACELTCIEPYPERLRSLLRPGDEGTRLRVLEQKLQEVDPATFEPLATGDILFVDSSHVSKIGSDVNYVLFELLPRLQPGVMVHFHDIFYPFEYPQDWILDGRAWNEAYLLRAFLEFNASFGILFFNHFLERCHPAEVHAVWPVFAKNSGGSIWLRKVR